ncbi:VanZ family protein [Bacillus sp. CGMCC 1.16541]|uniref:VanZ family protein n=1 Tax=Bacillus sp. CGMCC 1.16541 TaxID=2185143 RepID=UPI000D728342|nr:VanZ family protein [Bacillus sp. CGMCC 1.16541]
MSKSSILSFLFSQSLFIGFIPILTPLYSYLHPMVFFVLWICFTGFVTYIVYAVRNETITMSYRVFLVLIGVYTIGLLILLFNRPSEQQYGNMNLIPFATITLYLSGAANPLVAFYNLAANIGLFVPYGLWGRRSNQSTFVVLIITIVTISVIELTQYLTKRGSLDVDDLLLNVIGVFVGYVFYPLFYKVVRIT